MERGNVDDGPASSGGGAAATKPCSTCGEPRPVSATTCPHCGVS
jgi:hypothetical protein